MDFIQYNHGTRAFFPFRPPRGRINRDNQNHLVFLGLKLTAILGLAWTLSLAAAFKETEFLWYPFVVLNSLQGKVYKH